MVYSDFGSKLNFVKFRPSVLRGHLPHLVSIKGILRKLIFNELKKIKEGFCLNYCDSLFSVDNARCENDGGVIEIFSNIGSP